MATLWNYRVFFAVCTFALVAVRANQKDDLREFILLKDEVFGLEKQEFYSFTNNEKIFRLVSLLKTGNIPIDVQGDITLDYLDKLIADCKPEETCDLEKDFAKVERMKRRETSSPNLQKYLKNCSYKIFNSCAEVVYAEARKKLSPLDEQAWTAVRKFAIEVEYELNPQYNWGHLIRLGRKESDIKYYQIVLSVLRKLDPKASDKIAKRWTKKKDSLRVFMERIRTPCAIFLENLDPLVEVFPAQNNVYSYPRPFDQLTLWNFYRIHCKRILDQWEDIFKKSYGVYKEYLADPKPESTSCWGDFGSSSGGGGGFTTSDLLWMSAG